MRPLIHAFTAIALVAAACTAFAGPLDRACAQAESGPVSADCRQAQHEPVPGYLVAGVELTAGDPVAPVGSAVSE